MVLAFGGIGFFELVLIFMAVLLLFGAKKLPEVARGLGKAMKEFKKAKDEVAGEFDGDGSDADKTESSTAEK